jgi:hypothetical protein
LVLRRAGIGALLVSVSAGMVSNLLFLAAFQFRLDRFLEPTLILASGATPAELLRWAAVLDLFGYYLATAVLAYVLWRQLRPRNPLIADYGPHGGFRSWWCLHGLRGALHGELLGILGAAY